MFGCNVVQHLFLCGRFFYKSTKDFKSAALSSPVEADLLTVSMTSASSLAPISWARARGAVQSVGLEQSQAAGGGAACLGAERVRHIAQAAHGNKSTLLHGGRQVGLIALHCCKLESDVEHTERSAQTMSQTM